MTGGGRASRRHRPLRASLIPPPPSAAGSVDWASDAHEVCSVDASGAIRNRATIPRSQDGLDRLVGSLHRWAGEGEVLVGIERPEGRLVDRILEAGHPIVLIPTFAVKDLRRRFSVGGAKSDRADGYVLADVTRTLADAVGAMVRVMRALLSSIKDLDRQAYPRADWVAMLGGLCPVTHASGRADPRPRRARVIWRCWQDRTPYDPALHRAARRLNAA